jgi:serine/threonine-protein kinase
MPELPDENGADRRDPQRSERPSPGEAPAASRDDLDGALRSASGEKGGEDSHQSVVQALAAHGGMTASIQLRELVDEHTPVHRPAASRETGLPPRIGRYQVAGQIARGGMGSVHRARDVDLGRDIALKVLLECHQENPEMIRRFIEEAQISGQLQHPGIVPVHEMGLVGGKRPYLAMKFVKGQTLAHMLEDRENPSADRQRFLVIFEQVCQPLAYAHARGVIHRDLKPSNVMVGAFGEVQVMDWGLAKVLDDGGVADERRSRPTPRDASVIKTVRTGATGSDSLAGSVVGTPAYMAPEQARGEIDRLDERCDVFGLGAILCEILTGKPPFDAKSSEEAFRAARNGDLAGALARLEASGAEREVIDLARRCLAFEPRERPRDAGAVSKAVRLHLNSLSERAKALEIRAAQATERARGDRKARRLTLALALAAVLAVVGGAFGYLTVEGRRRETFREVDTEIAYAQALGDQARSSGRRDPVEWDVALKAAQRVEKRAVEKVPELGTRAGALREAIERGGRNAWFLARLAGLREEIFYQANAAGDYSFRYAFAQRFGRDFFTLRQEEALALLKDIGSAEELVHAFTVWGLTSRDPAQTRALLALSKALNPDRTLDRVLEAIAAEQHRDLQEEVSMALAGRLPDSSLQLLLVALLQGTQFGEPAPEIEALLRRAVEQYPENIMYYLLLGTVLLDTSEARGVEAMPFFTAALARAPRRIGVWYGVVSQLARARRWKEVLDCAVRGTLLLPGHLLFYGPAMAALQKSKPGELGPSLTRAIDSWERLESSGSPLSELAPEALAVARAILELERGNKAEAIRILETTPASGRPGSTSQSLLRRLNQRRKTPLATYLAVDRALLSTADIVPEGATWRYFTGRTAPSSGAEWIQPDFDDRGWPQGPGGFGYADDDDQTVLADMRDGYSTVFLRGAFDFSSAGKFESIELRVTIDDGCIVFLNGKEFGRKNAPLGSGPAPHDAVAPASIEDAVEARFPIPETLLREGRNTIAIQGLNGSGSSDFSLIPVVAGILKRQDALAAVREQLLSRDGSTQSVEPARRLGAYLDARALELERRPAEAAQRFIALVGEDPRAVEPRLGALRCLLEGPRDARLAEALRGLLTTGDPRHARIWNAWLRTCFVDLRRPPRAILGDLPASPSLGNAPERLTYQDEVRWLLERLDRREPIRIRCGGERYLDSEKNAWERDRFFDGGGCSVAAEGGWLISDILGTDHAPLYAANRNFDWAVAGTSGYRIPLPPGRYRVTLHFAEIWTSQSGVRVFNVLIEGKTVIADYDLVREVGFARADVKRFDVEVADGLLDIDFTSRHNRPMISAIEIDEE